MLRLERHFALPGIAHRRIVTWRAPALRVYVIDTAGIVFDTEVHRPAGVDLPRRAGQLAILCEGGYAYRYAGRRFTLGPGDALLAPRISWDERWEGRRFRILVIEWDPPHGDAIAWPSAFRLDAPSRDESSRLASVLLDEATAASSLPRVLELAIRLGAPLVPWHEAPPPGPPREVRLLHDTLSELLTRPTPAPMWIDLERSLGVASRTMRRWLDRNPDWFGGETSFRAQVSYWKLSSAALLLTAPGARLEDVARATGYGSGRALLKAMEVDGRPAPTAMRRALSG